MRKLILLSFTLLIAFANFAQNIIANNSPICQDPTKDRATQDFEWAEMQMWTATDINGNTHNLADYLAAGKTVFVDFSAVSCAPCWSLHQSGALDNLHNQYGPEGTGEIVVLWFEVSNATLAQIQGVGSGTQGDWTEGGSWPVPIIQASNELKSYFEELYEGYVPTMFMICQSGYYTTIDFSYNASYYMSQISSCPVSGQVPIAKLIGSTTAFLNTPASFHTKVVSVDPVTAYE